MPKYGVNYSAIRVENFEEILRGLSEFQINETKVGIGLGDIPKVNPKSKTVSYNLTIRCSKWIY